MLSPTSLIPVPMAARGCNPIKAPDYHESSAGNPLTRNRPLHGLPLWEASPLGDL